jgi:hypothetical protein
MKKKKNSSVKSITSEISNLQNMLGKVKDAG